MFQFAIAFILGCAFNTLVRREFMGHSLTIKRSEEEEEEQAELVILRSKVCAIRNELRNKIILCGQLSERNTILRERCRRLTVLANRKLLKGLSGDLRGRCGYMSDSGYGGGYGGGYGDGYGGFHSGGYDGYGHVVVKQSSYEV
jgi:hypothetical protein